MWKQANKVTVIALLALSLIALPPAVYATVCVDLGCWDGKVTYLNIGQDGRIWFVVANSSQLNNLVPPDGCTVRSIWTGQAEPALFISPTDPDRDEKYALLLTAFVNDSLIGFGPVLDPATGWCAVNNLSLR